MNRYDVTGYDRARTKLFTVPVEAPNESVAKLMAMAELRKSPEGTVKANLAEFLESELTWRDPK